jgi:hypothetical protein
MSATSTAELPLATAPAIDVPRRGYGEALRAGIVAARGTFIVMGDADDSYDFSEAPRFLDRLREGADLVQLAGTALLAIAVGRWWAVEFGNLDYARTMRLVVPGATLTALGFQTMLAGFFACIIGAARE